MALPVDLERLYDEHAHVLFAYLLNLTRSEEDTRDVLQDAFVRLAQRPEILAEVREIRPFLLRLVNNLAIDLFRRRQARQNTVERAGEEWQGIFARSPDPDEQSLCAALESALAELPPEQRAVVHLKLWSGLTFEQIAHTLQIPLNTAASRYRYGLDKLRERLRPIYKETK